MLSAIPKPLQLPEVSLAVTTGVKSLACRIGKGHLTESLVGQPVIP
jgi:hypothetical protein